MGFGVAGGLWGSGLGALVIQLWLGREPADPVRRALGFKVSGLGFGV